MWAPALPGLAYLFISFLAPENKKLIYYIVVPAHFKVDLVGTPVMPSKFWIGFVLGSVSQCPSL